jgi:rhodanese-related sulfurtransferase
VGNLDAALKLSEEQFKKQYGIPKMKKELNLIFTCRAGVRAEKACEIAASHGYKKLQNYKGSAKEWFGLPESPPPK